MFIFIGGPARCGKTTLTQKVQEYYQGQLLSLDNLRHSYLSIASDEQRAKLAPSAEIEDHTPEAWLKLLRTRDHALWDGAKAYLDSAAQVGDHVLLEGCMWPDYVKELSIPSRAVFLVDTSPEHVDRVIAAARDKSTHNNWMKDKSDEWLREWALYNIERSKLYVRLAEEHNHPVFDAGIAGYEKAQADALNYLLGSK